MPKQGVVVPLRLSLAALAGALVLAVPVTARVVRDTVYRGSLPRAGQVTFATSASGRSLPDGIAFSRLTARCGSRGRIELYNVEIDDRPMRIRGNRASVTRTRGDEMVVVRLRFRGRSVRGTVRVMIRSQGRLCDSRPVRFTALPDA